MSAVAAEGDGRRMDELLSVAGLPADATKTVSALVAKRLIRLERDTDGVQRIWALRSEAGQWPATVGVAPPPPSVGFRIKEQDGLRLVVPLPSKNDFAQSERHWRSLVVDEDGLIVSAGFPKFHSWGEHAGDTARLRQALARNEDDLWFSEKLDGSLIIRSVIDGQVRLRTRGMLDASGAIGPILHELIARRHPDLMDPDLCPDASMLFEFVSPEHQIVIRYPRPALTLIGASDHSWPPRLAGRGDLEGLAAASGVDLVNTQTLPREPRLLREAVRGLHGREGVVIRCNGGQTLVKMKSAEYSSQHTTRFSFTPERVQAFAADYGVADEDEFIAQVIAEGVAPDLAEGLRSSWRAARPVP